MNLNPINQIRAQYTPSMKQNDFGYRQVTDSQQINELHQNILNDVLDLFNRSNEFEEEIEYIQRTLTTENSFLRYRLNELEQTLAGLAEKIRQTEQGRKVKKIAIFPNQMTTVDDGHEALIDYESLSVTMKPTRSVSKVNIYDETLDTTYVPNSLELTYGQSTSQEGYDILQIEDNGPERAFNGDPSDYWVRRHLCYGNCQEVRCELIIGLPENVITTKNINMIKINPYPVDAVDVISVDLKVNGNWVPVPGFLTHGRNALESYQDILGNEKEEIYICNAPNLKFDFKELSASEVRISLRQRNYIRQDNDMREFYIGLKSVSIMQCSYHNDYYTFQADVNFPEVDRTIQIEDTEIILNNPGEHAYNQIQYEYYAYDNAGVPHRISQTTPFTLKGHRLLIKFKMPEASSTPNVRQVNVHYKPL